MKTDDSNLIIIVEATRHWHRTRKMPKNIRAFFSTKKESGRGLGLGLASAKDIVEKNFHGTISAENCQSKMAALGHDS